MFIHITLQGVSKRGLNLERWIVCMPLSANVFVTLSIQYHLEYHCKALLETSCITSGSHIEL
jgi:hypothetical protein